MKFRCLLVLAFLVSATRGAAPQSVEFKPVFDLNKRIVVEDIDQKSLKDILMLDEGVFLSFRVSRSHAGTSGIHISYLNIEGLKHCGMTSNEFCKAYTLVDETYTVEGPSFERIDIVPKDKQLTLEIVKIGDVIHLPDHGGSSHQYTPSAEYLGYFPGFLDAYEKYGKTVNVGGTARHLPFELFGADITDCMESKGYYLLEAGSRYFIAGKDDLRRMGGDAPNLEFSRRYDQYIDHFTQHAYIYGNDYYFQPDQGELEIFSIKRRDGRLYLEKMTSNPPMIEMRNWEYDYLYYFDRFMYTLFVAGPPILFQMYEVVGLEPYSAVSGEVWGGYQGGKPENSKRGGR